MTEEKLSCGCVFHNYSEIKICEYHRNMVIDDATMMEKINNEEYGEIGNN